MAGGDYGALRIAERAAIRVRSVGKEVSVLAKSKCECAYLFAPATNHEARYPGEQPFIGH